jgi:N6-L-threonylcarbamoyladenine synthase
MEPLILGIESSCDDTSVAVLRGKTVLANVTANQEIHHQYGGVVPELASRAHQQNIVPVVHQALAKAKITPKELSAIGFTSGPGLLGSLLVGTSFAKSMALSLQLPLIDVNHMQAHILAHFIEHPEMKAPPLPFLCLTISGGHTQIVLVKDYFHYEIIGETIDDAAGEAFDKAAKIMGLPYPGGPLIDKYAQKGNPKAFTFTKSKIPGFDYSFSGLKTNILYFLQKQVQANNHFVAENLEDLCASIQHTIVEMLFEKLEQAVEATGISAVAIAGGVSANSAIRTRLKQYTHWDTYIPAFEYCTDNGAMIAIAASVKHASGYAAEMDTRAKARMSVAQQKHD